MLDRKETEHDSNDPPVALACFAACSDLPNELELGPNCFSGQVLDPGEKCSPGGGATFEVMFDDTACLIESDGVSRKCGNKKVEKGEFLATNIQDTKRWRIESLWGYPTPNTETRRKTEMRIAIVSPLMALTIWNSDLEAQAVGDRVRASLADQTMVGEVTWVGEHGFQLSHEEGEHSVLFGDLVKLERSMGQKSAWKEGYVVGATLLIVPGLTLIGTCLDDSVIGDNIALGMFCLVFLVAPGIALVGAGVLITGPVGAMIGAFNRTDVWEQVTVAGSSRHPPAFRILPVQSLGRQRLEIAFRIPIR